MKPAPKRAGHGRLAERRACLAVASAGYDVLVVCLGHELRVVDAGGVALQMNRRCVTTAPREGPKAPARLQRFSGNPPTESKAWTAWEPARSQMRMRQSSEPETSRVPCSLQATWLAAPGALWSSRTQARRWTRAGSASTARRKARGSCPRCPARGPPSPGAPAPGPASRPSTARSTRMAAPRRPAGYAMASVAKLVGSTYSTAPAPGAQPGRGSTAARVVSAGGVVGEGRRGRAGRWEWRAGGGAGLAESGPGRTARLHLRSLPPHRPLHTNLPGPKLCTLFMLHLHGQYQSDNLPSHQPGWLE